MTEINVIVTPCPCRESRYMALDERANASRAPPARLALWKDAAAAPAQAPTAPTAPTAGLNGELGLSQPGSLGAQLQNPDSPETGFRTDAVTLLPRFCLLHSISSACEGLK
ncbi:unnamed protein product [Pleuronectes platessa]|uniref:Uncharacterized protein n=1 Tax=Pleuronectes platessa TaxID=8262 RepID=A0A9N7VTK3_PLEPL|nr:unnamed protein product [Pleuronectes platessa]